MYIIFKTRIAIVIEAFNRKISLLTSKLNIELKKKLARCTRPDQRSSLRAESARAIVSKPALEALR